MDYATRTYRFFMSPNVCYRFLYKNGNIFLMIDVANSLLTKFNFVLIYRDDTNLRPINVFFAMFLFVWFDATLFQ